MGMTGEIQRHHKHCGASSLICKDIKRVVAVLIFKAPVIVIFLPLFIAGHLCAFVEHMQHPVHLSACHHIWLRASG